MEMELENLSKVELIEQLRQQHLHTEKLSQHSQKLEHKTDTLQQEVYYLKLQLEKLKRLHFGQKRERFEVNPNQPQLPFDMKEEEVKLLEEETTEKISYERKKIKSSHAGRVPLPEHLPVEIIEIYPNEDITDMVCIGQEVTEELEYTPASYFIKRYIRYKFAPKDKENVHIGSLPSRLIEKGIAGPGLRASILVDKFVDHLPLYRQGQRFKRIGIPIPPSTLEGWTRQSLHTIEILYEHLLQQTKAKGYLQADETTIRVQDPDNKKGSCHLGYYWVYHCPIDGTVLFNYQPGRSTAAADYVLEGFKGYLQSDGYNVYEGIGNREGITHLACWAHARREFEGALGNDKQRAEIALIMIQSLYKVEAEARERNFSPGERKELRLVRSLPVLNTLGKWMKDEFMSGKVLPKSAMGKAIMYSLNRWELLNAYLYDGMLEIDNNLIENAIRPLAIGRKNYLFAGSHEAAKRAASIYSFFAMCKKEEVNPYEWLKYVFENIMETKVTCLNTLYPSYFKQLDKM